jgi:amino acid adenylation domain-containing protein
MTLLTGDPATQGADEIEPAAGEVYVLPSSCAQQSLWLVDRITPGSPLYNIPWAVRLAGRLDAGALAWTLGEVIRRHEILRTTLAAEGRDVVQVVAPPNPAGRWHLPCVDLGGLPAGRREPELRRRLAGEAARPFDLERGPLFRTLLLRLGRAEHVLLLSLHHVIADGWSLGVLRRELAACYRGETLPELPIQYADFAAWQREQLSGAALEHHLSWWREQLEGVPAVLELPLAGARPSVRSTRGVRRSLPLPPETGERLRALGQREGATPFVVLLAAFQTLLYRWTGQEDFLVGTPVAGRSLVETEELIGLFANLVPVRAGFGGAGDGPPFAEVLRRAREAFLGAHAHQDLPFERLVEELQPARSLSHAPLVQAIFTFQEEPGARPGDWPGLRVEPVEAHHGEIKFDLGLSVEARPGGWVASLDAAADLFEPVGLLRLLDSYGALLAGIAADPARPVGRLPVMAGAVLHQALSEWNDTASGYPRSATIEELFAERAAAAPDAVALEAEGEIWTYRELDERTNRLARHLVARGAGPEVRVGVCLNRSLEAIEAILAVLKAGGVYVPLEPAYPKERLALMIEDAAAPVVVTTSAHLASLPEGLARDLVVLDRDREAIAAQSAEPPESRVTPDSMAYIVYTSGSTGRPKGVAVPHRAVVRLVRRTGFADLSAGETWLQLAPIVFDASTLEIWGSLLNGARLVVFPGYQPSLEELGEAIVRQGITSLWLTAGLFHQMVEGPLESLRGVRQLLAGGDVLSVPHVEKVLARFPGLLLVNGYGPTENTTFTACHRMRGSTVFTGSVPIGRSIAATHVVLLDRRIETVPPGAVGELYAGGDGLARGYLGRPDLTAERFVPDPLGRPPDARLYRTGDLASWRPDGTLEFLGRADSQVKIRGFRIEPGEVEAAICLHPEVRLAVVALREDRLVAYVVPAVPADLRARLQERLPDHLVPAVFVALEALPLDPNGKVDRRVLPAPEQPRESAGEAPATPLEEILAGIWAEVLRLERVGIHDDFFELGGHSLLATQVVSRVREVFGVELPLRRLFEAPTVAELSRAVEAVRGETGQVPPIFPRPRDGDPPASFAQERLWFLEELGEGGAVWNIPVALRLRGRLDVPALTAALNEIARRHETLRTIFRAEGGRVVQVIEPFAPRPLPVVELCGADPREAARLARSEAGRPFRLDRPPLWRALLLRLGEEEHDLLLVLHHILADGWSMGVLLRELSALYDGSVLGDLPVQYSDFAVWQREWLQGEVLERQIAWWRERLAGAPAVLELPADRPRPAVRSSCGGRLPVLLAEAESRGVHALARSLNATPYMVLLAVFEALLARCAGGGDAPVGTPIANRHRGEIEGLIGFFVNTLVLRVPLDGDPGSAELVRRAREVTLEAYARQDLPFERLVEALRPERDLSSSPLFQVLLILQNAPPARPSHLNWVLAELAAEEPEAKLDLTLALAEADNGFRGQLEYSRDLFDESTALRLLGHFRNLLAAAVAEPDRPVADLELLAPAERSHLLDVWNDTAAPGPRACLHELVAAQAARTPESAAVLWGGERLTYGDLLARSHRLAHRLRCLGVGPEVRVGVALERTPDLLVALLGVLAAGGAYVPLDPSYPQERLAFLLTDSLAPVLITESGVLDRLPSFDGTLLLLDRESFAEESETAPESGSTPGNLAYLIYTSGSTGRPKGVAIEHRSAAALLDWSAGVFPPEDLAGVLASTSVTFDLSVFELFLPLSRGGTVVLAENALALPELSAAGEVCLVNTVPSAAAALARSGGLPPGVRTINLAGEPLKRALVDQLYAIPGVERVFNLYGPSEDTTYSTFVLVPRGGGEPTIGVPVANTRAYVLDAGLRLLPLGVPGELFLAGEGLARGYLHRPDLTAERFVPDPFRGPGERLYRTGDRVRRRPDGELEFLGRLDHQVKIRGFRIEPGEIEAALLALPGVRDAVVLAREDFPGDKQPGETRLVAYLAPEVPADLRDLLRERLPGHMIPAAFVGLAALPLTPNGKVDRKALPAPEVDAAEESAVPRTPTEELLAGIFTEVLRTGRVGVHDSFFDLGGHSLLATQVVSRVREVCGVELPLRGLFASPTVAALARRVEEARRGGDGTQAPPLVALPRDGDPPASFAQERLWFLDQIGTLGAAYHLPMLLRLRGGLDVAALRRALDETVCRHEVLRTRFTLGAQGVVQVIDPALPLPLPLVDLARLPEAAAAEEAEALALGQACRPFDLTRGPLLRATLVRRRAEEHVLLLTLHHIVSDGWSNGILIRELSDLYAAFAGGRAPGLPELPVQYADFAAWQREWLRGEALERQLAFWRERLAGALAVLELPNDRPRPAVLGSRGARLPFALPAAASEGLRGLGRRAGATLFMTVLASLQTLLARVAGSSDVSVGSPIANRNRVETEGLIGLFVNTLVLRARIDGGASFADLLGQVREATLDAYAHQDVPFEKLVEELRPQRDTSHTPLFQVMLVLQNTPPVRLALPGLEIGGGEVDAGTAKLDLNLILGEAGDGRLTGAAEYNRDLFDAPTIARLLAGFAALLAAAAADPSRPALELPLLPEEARQQIVREWNDTAGPSPRGCLHQPFEAWAAQAPEALAVVASDERLTYGELDRRANRLAWHLRGLGVGRGSLVAVYLDRGAGMIVAVLAVHKAGGAYVPLETAWPAERVHGILAGQRIAHVVTSAARRGEIDNLPPLPRLDHVVCLEGDLAGLPETAPPATAGPEDLAYIIFTSGSTGRPKGVMVQHGPALNLVDWVSRTFAVGPGDLLLLVANLSFDLSVYDIFGTLAAGAAVRVASAVEQRDPQALARLLCREPVTFWDSAPAALQALVPYFPPPGSLPEPPALRLVFLSGDWIPVTLPAQVRASFPGARMIALGGATEATVWSNVFPVGTVDPAWASIPYGRPIRNARYHVLDAALSPCPVGVAGDLWIGGSCLALGYANEPAMTAEKYVPDPFAWAPGARLYRTGDRARSGPDGNLEFLGRLDTQVKVRGFRIELGEIEAVLAAHPGVREAVVLAREDRPGDQRLVAYVLPALDPPPTALVLRRFAQRKLPEYMLPSAFVLRESWPLSPTGKLDRKALPPPEAVPAVELQSSFEPPRSPLERTIAAAWCEIIGLDQVGMRENFFDAGGHSLLMARVQARLQEDLGRPLQLVDLFQYPTIEALARFLEAETEVRALPAARPAAAPSTGQGMGIAVIGMAGRFPAARTVEELWRNLCGGVESIRVFSDEELLAAGFPRHLLDDPRLVKARGALDGPDLFDAAFFDVPPREAQLLDPQQRLFLECAWEALEHAGWGAAERRPRVGVFAGVTENTYVHHLLADPDLLRSVGRQQISIANNHDYLPSRVSYKLDLRGPSVNVQTACSTSLVAVHLACLSLLHGDCEMALAGGASVQAREVSGYLYQEGGISSPDGHTRSFDARARGVVGGSGVGVVVLKRLEDALADGDTIHAVIRGTASNNDGAAKVGFTAPSVEGQATAIREALRAAGVEPADIDYVEAHGTGTPLGDPVEVAALAQAFQGAERCNLPSIKIGSVKSNIGHLDAASGVTGLIKTVLALREGTIPASLHFERPNPEIDFGPFEVNARTSPWPPLDGRPRRAGVSSFGIGGTNAHAVLEEAPAASPSDPPSRPAHLLVLSARTREALDAATVRLADHLDAHPEMKESDLADVAWTLQTGRKAFRHRRVLVCHDRDDAVAAPRDPERMDDGDSAAGERTVAFLFPGQGAQHPRMGEGLYQVEPAFRVALDECCDRLAPELGCDLRGVLFPKEGSEPEAARQLEQTALTQPALFAVEYALARLWMEWGVRPAALLGHSIGEYVAACLAGVFSLEDALALVTERGRLMQEMPEGAMLAVALPEEEVLSLIDGESGLGLAAVNSPRTSVVSGPVEAITELGARLEAQGLEPRRLHTSHAFHSALMEPAVMPFSERVRRVRLHPPRIPFISNVTGTWIRPEEATDPCYWARHLRAPVRFADGAGELLRQPGPILLEVGPGRTLTTLARQHAEKQAARRILPSLGTARDRRPDAETVLAALGRLWLESVEIDWPAVHAGERRRRVPLPTYPFERRSFWIGPARPAEQPTPVIAPPPVAPSAMLSPVEQAVAGAFRELLGVDQVRVHDDFFDLGGSSLLAVQLGSRLGQLLGLDLPAGFLLEASTVRDLAALVEARRSGVVGDARPTCLVRLQAGAPGRRPLFLVHQVGGHVFTFRALARVLGPDQPLYGLRSRGLEGDEEPFSRVEEMAEHDLALVRGVQPAGPYRIGGASMGGMVAFEMAHRLHAAGEEVELLTLLDTPCLDQMAPRPVEDVDFVTAVFAGRVPLIPEELRPLSTEEQLAYACEKARQANPSGGLELTEARRLFRVLRGNVDALYDYVPRPYPGRLLYFRAEQRRAVDPPRPEIPWIELARGGVEILLVPGDHQTMHEPPHVQAVAERLKRSLE